jgi:hypothetical protein
MSQPMTPKRLIERAKLLQEAADTEIANGRRQIGQNYQADGYFMADAADRIAKLEAELRVRDRALEEACKTRPLLLCNTPGAGDCRHQTAEFYMQIARAALAREQEAAPDADRP